MNGVIKTPHTEAITASISNKYIDVDGLRYFYKKLKKEFFENLSVSPTFEHKCNGCGGTLTLKAEDHIFVCPYCGNVYAIGTNMINDDGRY